MYDQNTELLNVNIYLTNHAYRKRPKNLRSFTNRSVTIERAGVKLITNMLNTVRTAEWRPILLVRALLALKIG